MRVVIQRVREASVTIDGDVKSSIGKGLLVFAGFENDDSQEDLIWMASKIAQLRIFPDTNEQMNLSVKDVNGELLVVSQFTLHALTKKGNRPSFILAAKPEVAIPLYESFVKELQNVSGIEVCTGTFGADMKVRLLNDGPVTITIDSKNKL